MKTVIDLNFPECPGYAPPTSEKECINVLREAHVFSGDGPSSYAHLSPLCTQLRRKSQGSPIHLHGSVPLSGLRSTDVSGKPPGYRGLSSRPAQQALPYGHPQSHLQKHAFNANKVGNWRIYVDFVQALIATASALMLQAQHNQRQ